MICPSCGFDNRAGSNFCSRCGHALPLACPACAAAVEAQDRFCPKCGTVLGDRVAPGQTKLASPPPLQPGVAESERRLVSVLFADLVGFTTLSERRDPEDVRELLSRYFDTARRLVGRYGGVVEKFIGDAVMAVWGTPSAQEDDAERAVRAALDLVQAVTTLGIEVGAPDLQARAGVLTGEAAVTLGAEGQGMVAGDLVNTASRVQAAAEPGSVLELVLAACDLTSWAQRLLLDGELRIAEPKRLRYRLWHVAAPSGPPRPPSGGAPAAQLAVGNRPGHRVRPPASPAVALLAGPVPTGRARPGKSRPVWACPWRRRYPTRHRPHPPRSSSDRPTLAGRRQAHRSRPLSTSPPAPPTPHERPRRPLRRQVLGRSTFAP
jgi:class 3 adenylate cyclase